MKNILILLILISIQSFAQVRDTTRHILANKDTLLTIKTTTNKTTSVSYTDISVSQIVKAYQTPDPIDTIQPPPPVSTLKIEGYGADAVGGPSSNVITVTSQSDFFSRVRNNTTVLFGANVTFNRSWYAEGLSYVTVDGNGFNVTFKGINDDGISFENSHHIVLKNIRVENCTGDGINATGTSNNIAILNCSSVGNGDGNIDLSATTSSGKLFTVQFCFIGNSKGSGNMLITTQNASVHHNLFIAEGGGEGAERNPYAHANYSPKGTNTSPNFDFRNNLIHGAPRYASGNGYGSVGNYVNNYYTSNKAGLINLCADNASCGTAYVSGNFNQPKSTGGTVRGTEYTITDKYKVTTTDARAAAKLILQNVGPAGQRTPYEQEKINSITVQ